MLDASTVLQFDVASDETACFAADIVELQNLLYEGSDGVQDCSQALCLYANMQDFANTRLGSGLKFWHGSQLYRADPGLSHNRSSATLLHLDVMPPAF